MSWIFLAIVGHLSNAAAFIIDKTLLATSFKRSATYAALIGMLSLVVIFAAPWVKVWPDSSVLPLVIGFGVLFVFGLWMFFEALRRAEASRVVPIVGSLIPLFTLAGTATFLGERLSWQQGIGFFLLLAATVILSSGKKGHIPDAKTIGIAVAASAFFAAASVCGKIAFERADFLGVFVLSRAFAGATGLLIALSDQKAWMELRGMIRPKPVKKNAERPHTMSVLVGQALGSFGFILVNAALAQGSAAIVNALQAVQYAAIVIAAWFGGNKLRRMLQEERTPMVMLTKGVAIACVAAGLALLSQSFSA